jgi:hypothetical protein
MRADFGDRMKNLLRKIDGRVDELQIGHLEMYIFVFWCET